MPTRSLKNHAGEGGVGVPFYWPQMQVEDTIIVLPSESTVVLIPTAWSMEQQPASKIWSNHWAQFPGFNHIRFVAREIGHHRSERNLTMLPQVAKH